MLENEVHSLVTPIADKRQSSANGAAHDGLSLKRIIGESAAMQSVKSRIARFSQYPRVPVLVTGETGTGKELVVNALHACSQLAGSPLTKINCAAIPDNLLESHLFGHERGAFSGAMYRKKGLVEMAEGGTLFLDEIGSLKPELQPKLLRFIEDGSFYRVGSEMTHHANLWIVAATNDCLHQKVCDGSFRADLFYRLKALEIQLPPLRKRASDIRLLTQSFLSRFTARYCVPPKALSPAALNCLIRYPWPGNVRELKLLIKSLHISTEENEISLSHLPETFVSPHTAKLPPDIFAGDCISLEELEKRYIAWLLLKQKMNISETARILGIHRKTLGRKLKQYGIEGSEGV